MGFIHSMMNDYKKAESFYREAVEVQRAALGPDHPRTADRINRLAFCYKQADQYAKAEELIGRRVLAIHKKAFGPDHPTTVNDLYDMALARLSRHAAIRQGRGVGPPRARKVRTRPCRVVQHPLGAGATLLRKEVSRKLDTYLSITASSGSAAG